MIQSVFVFLKGPDVVFQDSFLRYKRKSKSFDEFNANCTVCAGCWTARCSLMDFVEGNSTLQDQAEAIYEWMREGKQLLTMDGHLKKCLEAIKGL